MENKIKCKIFYFKTYAEVLTMGRKIKSTHTKRGGFGVFCFLISTLFVCSVFSSAGGGKCPEEEHTTCSGGPTILVTSAVYGEREFRK